MYMCCYDRLTGEDEQLRSDGGKFVFQRVDKFSREQLTRLSSAVEVALSVSICKYFCMLLLWFNIHRCALTMKWQSFI